MGVDTVVRSNVHYAAGICLVCAGLLIGSGTAIASADPDGGGSPEHSQSGSTGPGSAHRPKVAPGETPALRAAVILRKTIADVASVFGSGRVPGQQPPSTPANSTPTPAGPARATSTNNQSGTTTTTTDGASDAVSPSAGANNPVTNPVVTNSAPSGADAVTPVVDPTTAATDDIAPAATTVEEPVASVPEPVAAATTPVPGPVFWPLTPVSDVISSVEYMLTSVVYTLGPIATDLGSLLGVSPWSATADLIRSDRPTPASGTAEPLFAGSSVLSSRPDFKSEGVAGLPLTTDTGTASIGTIATTSGSAKLSAPVEVPLPHITAIPTSVTQFFAHAVRAVLRSPSLSALAALALPGIIGLFVITGAGIRLGYRQAKAVLALPASGLARYAPPQPLRLVRTRPAATISEPALRFVPRQIRGLPSLGPPLEQAA